MRYVLLPDERANHPLPFYLAMEEYVARAPQYRGEDLFFMWQVDPTVIFGRNQVAEREVNLEYCRAHGIAVCRRKSGGGCVFADRSNIMLACITDSSPGVEETFARYTRSVSAMLRALELDACSTERNDILIGDRKVSGNAFYHLGDRSIVHGTMLIDTDMAHMTAAITPSAQKLKAKGVESVRSRITTIHEHLPALTVDDFRAHARRFMCGDSEPLLLTDADVEAIRCLEREYADPEWVFGRAADAVTRSRRIDGAGEFQISLKVSDGGLITGCRISGDFFATGDLDALVASCIIGTPLDGAALRRALDGVDAGQVVHGLTNENLINLLL